MLSPTTDPDPAFTASVKDLIEHFAKNDSDVPRASDELKKQLNSKTASIAKDIVDHLKEMQFLTSETDSKGTTTFYYKLVRTDGFQFLNTARNSSGKIIEIGASKPEGKP
jgi:hypothetical protein